MCWEVWEEAGPSPEGKKKAMEVLKQEEKSSPYTGHKALRAPEGPPVSPSRSCLLLLPTSATHPLMCQALSCLRTFAPVTSSSQNAFAPELSCIL